MVNIWSNSSEMTEITTVMMAALIYVQLNLGTPVWCPTTGTKVVVQILLHLNPNFRNYRIQTSYHCNLAKL